MSLPGWRVNPASRTIPRRPRPESVRAAGLPAEPTGQGENLKTFAINHFPWTLWYALGIAFSDLCLALTDIPCPLAQSRRSFLRRGVGLRSLPVASNDARFFGIPRQATKSQPAAGCWVPGKVPDFSGPRMSNQQTTANPCFTDSSRGGREDSSRTQKQLRHASVLLHGYGKTERQA